MSLDDILDASAVYHLPADFLGGVGDAPTTSTARSSAPTAASGDENLENDEEGVDGREERDKAGRTAPRGEKRTGHCGVPGAPPPRRWLIDGVKRLQAIGV